MVNILGRQLLLTAQKLGVHIMQFPGEMAQTPDGRAWCVKALHPSDPIPDCRGIPDESSAPSVMLQYNSVVTIVPTGATNNWGFDLTIIPDVLVHGSYRTQNDAGVTTLVANILNQGLSPVGIANPSYTQRRAAWDAMGVEAYRLCYFGVSAYQDGPALADQGTVCAAQWEVARRKYNITFGATTLPVNSTANRRFVKYQPTDLADYNRSQFMPNAHFGPSKEGCYMPLRLTKTSQHWHTEADQEFILRTAQAPTVPGGDTYPVPVALVAGDEPYPAVIPGYTSTGPQIVGDLVYKPANGVWGGISARNLSVQTRFTLYFRVGIEARVYPGSLMSSQQKMSPTFDPVALASYFRINRELKDAYPVEFNDLGKLWDVISGAAKTVLPFIGNLGPVGMAVSTLGRGAVGVGDMIRSATRSNGVKADAPPAASVERVRDMQAAERAGAATASNGKKRKKVQKRIAQRK